MTIPTLVVSLTLLTLSYALLWHNQTAESVRQEETCPEGDCERGS